MCALHIVKIDFSQKDCKKPNKSHIEVTIGHYNQKRSKDIVIIGAGMAGLTAALYAGRMNLSVLVLK